MSGVIKVTGVMGQFDYDVCKMLIDRNIQNQGVDVQNLILQTHKRH